MCFRRFNFQQKFQRCQLFFPQKKRTLPKLTCNQLFVVVGQEPVRKKNRQPVQNYNLLVFKIKTLIQTRSDISLINSKLILPCDFVRTVKEANLKFSNLFLRVIEM